MKPLAVDLCCGLGGWSEGFLAEGWDCVGFDIERHDYGNGGYPGQLVLQDILTLDGRQFRGRVSGIVASPPCQKYSYMAMPWSKAKALIPWYRDPAYPERLVKLNALVNACFRIAKEAGCPIVLENVRGAQPWIGKARWLYGSFALWGDVPALMPCIPKRVVMKRGITHRSDGSTNFHGIKVGDRNVDRASGGHKWSSAFADHLKVPGNNSPRMCKDREVQRLCDAGVKVSGDWFGSYAEQKRMGTISPGRLHGKNSPKRKAASAMIAKIPFALSRHIAAVWKNGLSP